MPTATPMDRPLFPAWSAIDDVKHKAEAVGKSATKEFDKASAKVQSKTGHIEMHSAKYYASCTFGGLLACVSLFRIILLFQCSFFLFLSLITFTRRVRSHSNDND